MLDCAAAPPLPGGAVAWTTPIVTPQKNWWIFGVDASSVGHAFVKVSYGPANTYFLGNPSGMIIKELDRAGAILADHGVSILSNWAPVHTAQLLDPNSYVISGSTSTAFTHTEFILSPTASFYQVFNFTNNTATVSDAAGNALGEVIGAFGIMGSYDFGWGPESGARLVKWDALGKHVYSRPLTPLHTLTAAGDVFIGDAIAGSIDAGCGTIAGNGSYLARIDPAGACLWSRALDVGVKGAAFTALPMSAGAIDLANAQPGTIDLGCGPLAPAGASSSFVAQLDATGQCAWNRSFGVSPLKVTAFPNGDLLVAAAFSGSIDFGGAALTAAGTSDLAVAHLDAAGNLLWAQAFGGAGADLLLEDALAAPNGEVVLTGQITGSVDFGGGLLSDAGGFPRFVLKLDAAGTFAWDRSIAGATKAAVDPCGAVLLASGDQGFDVGNGPVLVNASAAVLSLAP